jgi:hypothetical protein
MQLEFVKKGYGPGDDAEALLEVSRYAISSDCQRRLWFD